MECRSLKHDNVNVCGQSPESGCKCLYKCLFLPKSSHHKLMTTRFSPSRCLPPAARARRRVLPRPAPPWLSGAHICLLSVVYRGRINTDLQQNARLRPVIQSFISSSRSFMRRGATGWRTELVLCAAIHRL